MSHEKKTPRLSREFLTRALLISSLFFSAQNLAFASTTFGQASDVFNIGAGARSMGMGSAFTGLADDASAPYFNPSGLAYLDEHQLMLMHAPLMLDTNYDYFASAHPFGDQWGSVSFSDSLLMSSGYSVRGVNNDLIDSNGSLRNNAFVASYAHKLPLDFAAGMNVKYIQQKIVGFSDSALGYDLGFMYRRSPLISVGAAFANINTPSIKLDQADDVFKPTKRFGVASEVFPNRLTLSADVVQTQGASAHYAAGMEYTANRLVNFRAGFNANQSFTFGLGLKFKQFRIDYAFSDTDLGAFNKVSFVWAWHNIYKAELEPPMKQGQAVFPLAGFENQVAFVSHVPSQMVARWNLVIKNSEDKEVRTLHADLRPPEKIMWDAKNNIGEPVGDGRYTYTFTVNYKNGKLWTVTGDLNLALPDRKVDQVIDMKLDVNGAKTAEEGELK